VKTIFQIGRHVLQVIGEDDRWVVAVDGVLRERWYSSEAQAWAAGVGEADSLERSSPSPTECR
jgi:hypothetical protein